MKEIDIQEEQIEDEIFFAQIDKEKSKLYKKMLNTDDSKILAKLKAKLHDLDKQISEFEKSKNDIFETKCPQNDYEVKSNVYFSERKCDNTLVDFLKNFVGSVQEYNKLIHGDSSYCSRELGEEHGHMDLESAKKSQGYSEHSDDCNEGSGKIQSHLDINLVGKVQEYSPVLHGNDEVSDIIQGNLDINPDGKVQEYNKLTHGGDSMNLEGSIDNQSDKGIFHDFEVSNISYFLGSDYASQNDHNLCANSDKVSLNPQEHYFNDLHKNNLQSVSNPYRFLLKVNSSFSAGRERNRICKYIHKLRITEDTYIRRVIELRKSDKKFSYSDYRPQKKLSKNTDLNENHSIEDSHQSKEVEDLISNTNQSFDSGFPHRTSDCSIMNMDTNKIDITKNLIETKSSCFVNTNSSSKHVLHHLNRNTDSYSMELSGKEKNISDISIENQNLIVQNLNWEQNDDPKTLIEGRNISLIGSSINQERSFKNVTYNLENLDRIISTQSQISNQTISHALKSSTTIVGTGKNEDIAKNNSDLKNFNSIQSLRTPESTTCQINPESPNNEQSPGKSDTILQDSVAIPNQIDIKSSYNLTDIRTHQDSMVVSCDSISYAKSKISFKEAVNVYKFKNNYFLNLFRGNDCNKNEVLIEKLEAAQCNKKIALDCFEFGKKQLKSDLTFEVRNFYRFLLQDTFQIADLKIPSFLWNNLFSYQKEAVKWMYDLFMKKKGCVLADEMGLGKTIQIIALLSGLYITNIIQYTIIVSPSTILKQWVNEFKKFFPFVRLILLHKSHTPCIETLINEIFTHPCVILVSYDGLKTYLPVLENINFSIIILDEGHKIKNKDTVISSTVSKVNCNFKIALTGTPIQNNLIELWAIFDFINKGLLGTINDYIVEFEVPIKQGGYSCASEKTVINAYKKSKQLKSLIHPYILRRTKKTINHNLPSKSDIVAFCKLSKKQELLYKRFIGSEYVEGIFNGKNSFLSGVMVLRKICNHPFLYTNEKCFENSTKNSKNEKDFHNTGENTSKNKKKYKEHSIRSIAIINSDLVHNDMMFHDEFFSDFKSDEIEKNTFVDFTASHGSDVELIMTPNYENSNILEDFVNLSGKLKKTHELLTKWKKEGYKVLLFTQLLGMVEIFEQYFTFLSIKYRKMDGKTTLIQREKCISEFNEDPSIFVFLMTTRVGGLGLNLVSANRIIVYDPDWNPSVDSQAKNRAWRFGQEKDVQIYRLISAGTIEEKIYKRQVFKNLLSKKVLIDARISKFFIKDDICELFSYDYDNSEREEKNRIKDDEDESELEFVKKEIPQNIKDKFGALKDKEQLNDDEMIEYILLREQDNL